MSCLSFKGGKRTQCCTIPLDSCVAKTRYGEKGKIAGRNVEEHCRIAGEVARQLLEGYFSSIAYLFPENAWIMAALHDIGKVSPTFQKKIHEAIHLPISGLANAEVKNERIWGGHPAVGYATIQSHYKNDALAQIVGYHHGRNFSKNKCIFFDYGGPEWEKMRCELADRLRGDLPLPTVHGFLQEILVLGLVVLADWIASGEIFDDYGTAWTDLVPRAISKAGFIMPEVRSGLEFNKIFPFEPNEIQRAFMENINGPGVYVLEAPMGMGKTEAALAAAYKLLANGRASGIYFGLPTQLTSNMIFERVNAFLKNIVADDRDFSMGKLCKKLGEFEAGNYEKEMPKPEVEPLYPALLPVWEQFRAEWETENEQRAEINAKKEQESKLLKEKQAQERLEKLARFAKYGLPILNIARHCLKIEHARQLKFLLERFKESLPAKIKKCFPEWLKEHEFASIATAHAINAEEKNRHTPAPAIQPTPNAQSPQELAFLEYSRAVNAERYRVTAIRMEDDGSRKVFILDKKDGKSQGFTPDELAQKMPEILNLQRRGENIYYTPLSDDKHHILIDDVSPENVVRLQKDGYKPAAIIESSPGNFQCILTIPKFDGEFDRQIANQLTAKLNREYGDPKLSGAIHPHRAPGFENRKPKHRGKNGNYPLVLLRYAIQQICRKAVVEARKLEQAMSKQAAERKKVRPVFAVVSPGSPQQAYFAHYENIRAHLAIEDFSRVDAMIALRMRATGHSPESVLAAIRDCAPAIREGTGKRRNWPIYAERTINYAFGYAGDRDLQQNERYIGLWQRIEKSENYQTRMKVPKR